MVVVSGLEPESVAYKATALTFVLHDYKGERFYSLTSLSILSYNRDKVKFLIKESTSSPLDLILVCQSGVEYFSFA